MNLHDKVKKYLEIEKNYSFDTENWTGEMLTILSDAIEATEAVMNEPSVVKDCTNCIHKKISVLKDPCINCYGFSKHQMK